MVIQVEYIDSIKKYNTFDELLQATNNDMVLSINCSSNNLSSLPENMNFPNLHTFSCSFNKISIIINMNFPNLHNFYCNDNIISIIKNINFPNLHTFYCCRNKLTQLPENMNFPNLYSFDCRDNNLESLYNMNFPNLHNFYCSNNKLVSLEDMNFPNLRTFDCSMNNLKSLPENMNCPNLYNLYCYNNQLYKLPENMNFPNLHTFYCDNNQLKQLPVSIFNSINITDIRYHNNTIELSPQIARFLNMIHTKPHDKLSVYNDKQNIHNTTIQLSVKDSINKLTSRSDVPKYKKDILHHIISENDILTEKSKKLLFEYIKDTTVHSLLLLTFSEVLWYTLQTIIKDFNKSTQKQIYEIMNQELMDAESKCFTGRMSRIINCLNGFSKLVLICINDSEQIGNIIVMVKNRLTILSIYTVEKHKEEVRKELLERGYKEDVIKEWVVYIE